MCVEHQQFEKSVFLFPQLKPSNIHIYTFHECFVYGQMGEAIWQTKVRACFYGGSSAAEQIIYSIIETTETFDEGTTPVVFQSLLSQQLADTSVRVSSGTRDKFSNYN